MSKVISVEKIWCPECEHIQDADVLEAFPWNVRIKDCENCGYLIMESEWNLLKKESDDKKVGSTEH